jgi:hypothetical protein
MVQPITGKPILPERLVKRTVVREVHRQDPEVELMPPPEDVKRWRFDNGALCLGAFVDERMVAYMWLREGAYEEDEVRCDYVLEPPSESVFDFDVYVLPEARMTLAFVGLWHGANEYLFRRGVRHSFSRVNHFNLASKRAHDRLGWYRVGRTVVLRLWRLQLLFADCLPYLSVSVSARPKLVLKA